MGSLTTSPQLPASPRQARVAGIRPSVPLPWLALSKILPPEPARVALGALSTLIVAALPRQAGSPGFAIVLGGLMDPTTGMSNALQLAVAILSAATLAFLLAPGSGNSQSMETSP